MHHYYTFLILELTRERVDEAARERLANAARHDRRPFGERLRQALSGLTGGRPAAEDRSGLPAPSH